MLNDFHCDILHEQEWGVSKELLDIALNKLCYFCLSVDIVLHLFVKVEEEVRRLDVSIEQCLKSLSKYFALRISALFMAIFLWTTS